MGCATSSDVAGPDRRPKPLPRKKSTRRGLRLSIDDSDPHTSTNDEGAIAPPTALASGAVGPPRTPEKPRTQLPGAPPAAIAADATLPRRMQRSRVTANTTDGPVRAFPLVLATAEEERASSAAVLSSISSAPGRSVATNTTARPQSPRPQMSPLPSGTEHPSPPEHSGDEGDGRVSPGTAATREPPPNLSFSQRDGFVNPLAGPPPGLAATDGEGASPNDSNATKPQQNDAEPSPQEQQDVPHLLKHHSSLTSNGASVVSPQRLASGSARSTTPGASHLTHPKDVMTAGLGVSQDFMLSSGTTAEGSGMTKGVLASRRPPTSSPHRAPSSAFATSGSFFPSTTVNDASPSALAALHLDEELTVDETSRRESRRSLPFQGDPPRQSPQAPLSPRSSAPRTAEERHGNVDVSRTDRRTKVTASSFRTPKQRGLATPDIPEKVKKVTASAPTGAGAKSKSKDGRASRPRGETPPRSKKSKDRSGKEKGSTLLLMPYRLSAEQQHKALQGTFTQLTATRKARIQTWIDNGVARCGDGARPRQSPSWRLSPPAPGALSLDSRPAPTQPIDDDTHLLTSLPDEEQQQQRQHNLSLFAGLASGRIRLPDPDGDPNDSVHHGSIDSQSTHASYLLVPGSVPAPSDFLKSEQKMSASILVQVQPTPDVIDQARSRSKDVGQSAGSQATRRDSAQHPQQFGARRRSSQRTPAVVASSRVELQSGVLSPSDGEASPCHEQQHRSSPFPVPHDGSPEKPDEDEVRAGSGARGSSGSISITAGLAMFGVVIDDGVDAELFAVQRRRSADRSNSKHASMKAQAGVNGHAESGVGGEACDDLEHNSVGICEISSHYSGPNIEDDDDEDEEEESTSTDSTGASARAGRTVVARHRSATTTSTTNGLSEAPPKVSARSSDASRILTSPTSDGGHRVASSADPPPIHHWRPVDDAEPAGETGDGPRRHPVASLRMSVHDSHRSSTASAVRPHSSHRQSESETHREAPVISAVRRVTTTVVATEGWAIKRTSGL